MREGCRVNVRVSRWVDEWANERAGGWAGARVLGWASGREGRWVGGLGSG